MPVRNLPGQLDPANFDPAYFFRKYTLNFLKTCFSHYGNFSFPQEVYSGDKKKDFSRYILILFFTNLFRTITNT